MAGPNSTQPDSEGQPCAVQLKRVQYPDGCEVSQRRTPVLEQSVESVQLSPIEG